MFITLFWCILLTIALIFVCADLAVYYVKLLTANSLFLYCKV